VRLVQVRDGVLEIRWTWLPFWLAANPKLKTQVEREMRDAVLLGGVTASDADLDALHDFVVRRLQAVFSAFPGLAAYLDGIRDVEEPAPRT
jgi:hypothetical protein